MDSQLKWYKKSALTGDWTALVCAASEAEVRELHEHEQRLFPALAQQYPGPYQVEEFPPASLPPPVLEALEQGDFARVEQELGLPPSAAEGVEQEQEAR